MVKPRDKSTRVPVRLRHKIEKRRSKARMERKEAKKHPGVYRKKKNDGQPKEEQLKRREIAKQRMKEWADGKESNEDDLHILGMGVEGSSGLYSDGINENNADTRTGCSEITETPSSSMTPAQSHAFVENLSEIIEQQSGLPDNRITARAIRELPAGGIPNQLSSMSDIIISSQMFQELETKWYQRYEKLNEVIKEKSIQVSKLTCLALSWKTEKIKLEGNFNLRGALERIAYHGRLIGEIKSHYTQGVQAGLDELARTGKFKELLTWEVEKRHLVRKDVARCIAVVYHEASKHAHGNSRIITIYEEDHTVNECAALATFLGVQEDWEDSLEWKEVKRTE